MTQQIFKQIFNSRLVRTGKRFAKNKRRFSVYFLAFFIIVSLVAFETACSEEDLEAVICIYFGGAASNDDDACWLDPEFENGMGSSENTGFSEADAFAPGATPISAFAVDTRTGNFFIGGSFASADNSKAYNIAYYDTVTDRWSALTGLGLRTNFGGRVLSLAISGNYLYVGGNFNQTYDGTVTNLNGIARYDIDAKTWSPLPGNGLKDIFGGDARVYSLTISGNDLFVGGRFAQTFDNSVTNLKSIARYNLNTNTWSAFAGNGLSDSGGTFGGGNVNSLIISGNDLIVGGFFSQTTNGAVTNLNYIARYNTTTNTWSSFTGNGLTGEVETMTVSGNNLYVGGTFHQTFDGSTTNLWRIARYNLTTNNWSSLTGDGLSGTAYSLTAIGDFLYVGGEFSQTQNGATTNLNNIARYNTVTNVWSTLTDNGLNDSVGALAVSGGNLYVGGRFSQTFDGTTLKNAHSIVRYDISTNTWSKIGLKNGKALDNQINALAADTSGNIYAGGSFTLAADGTTNLNGIARYNPTTKTWTALANNGLNGTVNALVISGDNLYVGGIFTATFDGALTNLNNIAKYNLTTSTWSSFAGNGLNSAVYSLAISGDILYAGGAFSMSANGATTNLRRVARYNLTTNAWSSLTGNGLNNLVTSLTISGNNLYTAGYFTQTFDGATNLSYIARYDTATNTWSSLANNGLNSNVGAMTFSEGFLNIRGGNFSATGDNSIALNRIARYDTASNQWSAVTTNAQALASVTETNAAVLSGNELYVGGSFTALGGIVTNYFSRIYLQQWKISASGSDWHTGSNWSTNAVPAFNSNAVIPEGATNINILSADVTMDDLAINDGILNIGAGRTLTINGKLNLNGGTITGEGTLIITNCQSEGILNAGATAYIQTTLVRCVDSKDTYTFPVGTANGYSPVTVKNIIGTGNISVKANQGAYSNPANGLPSNRSARWWQVENPGGGITNTDIYFGYQQTDIAGNENNYRAYRISDGMAQMINSSVNIYSNYVTAQNVTGFSNWTLAEFAPTAANVSIGGKVANAKGSGQAKVLISLTDSSGNIRTAMTNSFGYYQFEDIAVGQTYIISAQNRHYQIDNPTRVLTIDEARNDIDFTVSQW